jgi:SAM-dependent methyltransferase
VTLFKPPNPSTFSLSDVEGYFGNTFAEWQDVSFSESERKQLSTVMLKKFLDPRERQFFLYHFGALIQKAVNTFFGANPCPSILEVGSGSGSLSILFALLGARVIAFDVDPDLFTACRKRQAYYESKFGSLDLQFHCADAFKFPYQQIKPVDGIYSLFAFNTMQPSRTLLPNLLRALKPGGTLLVSDGNKSGLYNRLFRRRGAFSPRQMADALTRNGCSIREISFDCALPPLVARTRPLFRLGLRGEKALARLGLMSCLGVSYTVVAQKGKTS